MRGILVYSLSAAFLVILGSRSAADETARAVIEKAVQALGGASELERVGAWQEKVKGSVYAPDAMEFTGEAAEELPYKQKFALKLEVQGLPTTLTQVFDGKRGWNRTGEDVTEANGQELKTLRELAHKDYVASLLPLLRSQSYALESLGEAKVNNEPAVGVKVSSKGHPDIKLYFDKKNYYLVKSAYQGLDSDTNKRILREEYYSDYRIVNTTAADEQTLRTAGLGTEGRALIDYLKKQTPTEETQKKVRTLLKELGNASFQARERAKKNLVALKEVAAPFLSQELENKDAEVADAAKECLEQIGKKPATDTVTAVIRLLSQRRSADATGALLAYLPCAPNAAVRGDVQVALAIVGFHDGQPDKALAKAAQDNDPTRRAVAAALVNGFAKSGQGAPGMRVLTSGYKAAWKGVQYRDSKKELEWEITELTLYNRLPDAVFGKP